MRHSLTAFWLAAALITVSGAARAADGTAPTAPANLVITPAPWGDLGPRVYGHNYQVYIPLEPKSNDPDALRSTNVSGYPRNGRQMTPEGAACAADNDCAAPMGCFPRADTGAIPIKVCAFPPAY